MHLEYKEEYTEFSCVIKTFADFLRARERELRERELRERERVEREERERELRKRES